MTSRCFTSARTTALVSSIAVAAAGFGAAGARLAAQPATSTAAQTTVAGSAAHGKVVYDAHCVECHGKTGKGDGPASPFLTPRPRDFTSGKYKIRSTETSNVPTDEDLVRSVSQGLYGSAMPGWAPLLSDADIRDVVTYLKTMTPRFLNEPPKVVTLGAAPASSPESVNRGREVYEKLRCGSCHGTDGRGTGAIATTFEDDWQQPLRAADLTEPWTFHGGAAARDVYLRFRTGMSGTPMPSFVDTASEAEMWDLANFVGSLARKPVWSMTAPEIADHYTRGAEQARRNPIEHGRLLVQTHLCAICHSPMDENGRIITSMYMAGGQLMRIVPFGDYPTGNLTSDKDTGLGNWSDEQIKQAITRGILRDGTRLPPYPMDWAAFSALTSDDLNAMVAYLRTIPAVSNQVPRPTRPSLPVYLWGKFKLLILKTDPPIVIFPGNVGMRGGQ
jgi:cbb3-type cytochrome c oxidase subunit III